MDDIHQKIVCNKISYIYLSIQFRFVDYDFFHLNYLLPLLLLREWAKEKQNCKMRGNATTEHVSEMKWIRGRIQEENNIRNTFFILTRIDGHCCNNGISTSEYAMREVFFSSSLLLHFLFSFIQSNNIFIFIFFVASASASAFIRLHSYFDWSISKWMWLLYEEQTLNAECISDFEHLSSRDMGKRVRRERQNKTK